MRRNDSKTLYRRVLTVVMAVLLCLLPAAVFAVNTDYSGYVDPQTNEPIAAESSTNGSARVFIDEGVYYDWTTTDFVYEVDNSNNEVHAGVMDGMTVSGPVMISTGGDVSVAVFRNGEAYTGDLSNIKEVGSYAVSVVQGSSMKRLLGFQIVGNTTNSLMTFTTPENFFINSAFLDGIDIYEGRYSVDMEREGAYVINYQCGPTEQEYTLEVTIDRTAPSLKFTGSIDTQKRVHSALSFSGLEEGDTIYLLRDGVEAEPILNADGTGKILDTGTYIMRVYDAAGNMHEYTFTIMMYLNGGSWLFVLLVLGSAAAVFFYVRFKRKHLKIG